MTINSISFLGQSAYVKGTSLRKPPSKARNKNFKVIEKPNRQFKVYDLKNNNSKPDFQYGLFDENEILYIDTTKNKQSSTVKHKKSKHKKPFKILPLVLATTAASSTLSAAATALYLNSITPDVQVPKYTIPFEQISKIDYENDYNIDDVSFYSETQTADTEETQTNNIEKETQTADIEEETEIPEEEITIENPLEKEYNGAFNFKLTLSDDVRKGLEKFMKIWNNPEKRQMYINVGNALGIPAEIVAVNHYRESDCNFDCSQVDGTPLNETDFNNWEESAIHAYTERGIDLSVIDKNDMNSWLEFLENYNGGGYKEANINTPYVWSGTEHYTKGKYISNGEYNAEQVDKQPGCAIMLREIFMGDVLDPNKTIETASID